MNVLKCPSEWKTVPLRSVTVPNDGVQTGPFGSQLHREDYVEEGTPMITVEHIGNNKILHTRAPCISDQDRERLKKFWLDVGDIVFSRVGSVDRRAIVKDDEKGWLFSGSCLRVRVDRSKIEPLYLSYYLGHPLIKNHLRSIALGSTRPSINTTILSDLPISFPASLSEQKAIASILGTLDDKIEVNQKMNRTLEEIAKAIFKSWFVDFDPVRAKMEGQPTGLPSDISDLFPDELVESELGQIPKGWETKALDDIGVFKNGLALQKFPAKDGMAKLPVVKIAQLRKGNTLGDNPLASNVPSEYIINDGDFIFSWSGSLLAKYWVGGPGALNQHLFKVEERSAPLWLVANWVLQHLPEFRIIAKSKATTMGHIKREHLKEAICVVPSAGILNWGQEVIAPLIDRSVIALKENRILSSLRDTLLPKLISGEIRVPDAEKFLEETVS